MEAMLGLLGFIALIEFVAVPVLFVLVLSDRSRTAQRLEALMRRIATLEARLGGTAAPAAAAAPAHAPEAAVTTPPEPAAVPAPATVAAPASAPANPPTPVPVAAATAAPTPPRVSLEERVMRRWIVWLGGVALCLGAGFLVKYSVDQGYFGPVARVVAGAILGLALRVASEVARRGDIGKPADFGGRPDAIPQALAASGSVALFASVYGAYALYDLLGPLAAFVLLAFVAAATVLLSLLHGAAMAWLGLIGVYVVPALVTTPHPSAVGLLGYVGIATAGSMALLRWRGWVWLGWVAFAGAATWSLLALLEWSADELRWPLGLFLMALPVLFVLVADAVGDYAEARLRRPAAWIASGFAALTMWALLEGADYDTVMLGIAFAQIALLTALAWRYPPVDRLAWIGAALAAIVIACWRFEAVDRPGRDSLHLLLLPPASGTGSYVLLAALLGVLYGFGGFALLWRAANPARWAIVSAVTPLLLLIAAYWRLEHFALSLPWAGIALLLAALALAAVERLAPHGDEERHRLALAVYAVAMTAAVTLALTLTLRVGWLTVALALELPALAAVNRRVPSPAFKRVAAILAAIVLVRLLLNPQLRHYALDARPILNDLLYLYGVPLLSFLAASQLFRLDESDRTRWLLDGGAVALTLALVSVEIRHLVHGGRLVGPYELGEQGLFSTAWLGLAVLLMRYGFGLARVVREFAWRFMAVVAAINIVVISALLANPLLVPIDVGHNPFFNALLLAFGAPALLALFLAHPLARRTHPGIGALSGVLGLALVFLYVTMQVRHWFVGPILAEGEPSDAEWYAYSAVWLVYGAALLGLGIVRQAPMLRIAGLAVGGIVAVKAFIFDMAALTGLYRAASFLGLGASLIGLAYLYQHLVVRSRAVNGAGAFPSDGTPKAPAGPPPPG